MKKLFVILFFLIPLTTFGKTAAKLRYSKEFIFEKVLELKRQSLKPEVPFPVVYFESKTPLTQFQDAIEEQWGMRPDRITNAFAVKRNEIYMNDDADYYLRTNRCMDDSLAHEMVHYVQAKYQGWDLNDDSLEWEAIDIQTAFREAYCL
jgi:hypothetical protein